jgi:DNA-binding phage protein
MARPKPVGKSWIVGELVKIAEESGQKLEEVAMVAGAQRNTLYRWKGVDGVNPTLDTVERVARALGYELELVLDPAGARGTPPRTFGDMEGITT